MYGLGGDQQLFYLAAFCSLREIRYTDTILAWDETSAGTSGCKVSGSDYGLFYVRYARVSVEKL
jgi:hypothetical protein